MAENFTSPYGDGFEVRLDGDLGDVYRHSADQDVADLSALDSLPPIIEDETDSSELYGDPSILDDPKRFNI